MFLISFSYHFSFVLAASAHWYERLDDTSLYFQHLGSLKLEGGTFKVVKTLDLTLIENQITRLRQEMVEFSQICLENDCHVTRAKGELYIHESERLHKELKTIYSLMNNNRHKRSLNFIGSGIKYLFGNMDHNDELYIKDILTDVGHRQDQLHSVVNETVQIIKGMNKQWSVLIDNQNTLYNNFLSLKAFVNTQYGTTLKLQWELDERTFEVHLDNLVLSVQVQVDKLRNAILFLKAGVVDPYFVDSDELIKALSFKNLNYNVTEKEIDIIMGNSKPVALCDPINKKIHIIFLIPTAQDKNYDLYENLLIPKVVKTDVVILNEIPRYSVFSDNHLDYFSLEVLDCFKVSDLFICKNTVILKEKIENCISDMFYNSTDKLCDYKKLSHNFDIKNVVNTGLIVFSSKGLKVELICGKIIEEEVFVGSFFLEPPSNCVVNSSLF